MSKLPDKSALDGFSRNWGEFSLSELTEFELVSVAMAQGQGAQFKSRFKKAFRTNLPIPNQVLPAKVSSVIWTGQDQYLVMLGVRDINADVSLAQAFGDSAYTVLQSDGWACLRAEGERVLDVFERFIPLDLRNAPEDFAARTQAHHIAVIVIKLLDGSILLLTPRSSAKSFLEGLVHITEHVIN